MALLSDSAVHLQLDALAAVIDRVSLHSAYSSTGTNEIAGSGYARQTMAWAAAASRKVASSGSISWTVPAGQAPAYVGLWTNSGSVFRGMLPLRGASGVQGFATVDGTDVSSDTLSSNGHGLAVDNRVIVEAVNGEALPTGLSAGTIYWVTNVPDVDNFKLATTQGGAAVDVTGKGELWFSQITPEAFTNAGTLTAGAGTIVIDASLVAN